MCILLQRISNPCDFVKYISGKMSLRRKKLVAQNLLLRGKIKKVLSLANVCSLEQKARNAHDQNEQTLSRTRFIFSKLKLVNRPSFHFNCTYNEHVKSETSAKEQIPFYIYSEEVHKM